MSVQSVKIRVRGGYIEIPFTDPESIERIFRGVTELKRIVNLKTGNDRS